MKLFVCTLVLTSSIAFAQSREPQVPTDWHLHAMRIINNARVDPVAEDERQAKLSFPTSRTAEAYGEDPAPPLAYNTQLGQAAQNHTDWMEVNRRRVTHYETTNGEKDGPTGEHTKGWSGDTFGDRIRYVQGDIVPRAENVGGRWPFKDRQYQAEWTHRRFWVSAGHRRNLMGDSKAFGAGISEGYTDDDDRFHGGKATHLFGRPKTNESYLLGLIYTDVDKNGVWTPTDDSSEGLGGVKYEVKSRNRVVITGETLSTGSYSIKLPAGDYDVLFSDTRLPGGHWQLSSTLQDANVDLGDLRVISNPKPGDANLDGKVSFIDFLILADHFDDQDAFWQHGDFDSDGRVAFQDFLTLASNFEQTTVAAISEPSSFSPFLAVLAITVLRLAALD